MPIDQQDAIADLAHAICHDATSCRVCFSGPRLASATVGIAQPRWIGPGYAGSSQKVLFLLLNPASGARDHDVDNRCLNRILEAYRAGEADLEEVFSYQRSTMPGWGGGKFVHFYLKGLDQSLDDVAFANLAWCAERDDRYPLWMLRECFRRHTAPLLNRLAPDIIMLSGVNTHRFAPAINDLCQAAQVHPMLHYAHRGGDAMTASELRRVRSLILAARRSM